MRLGKWDGGRGRGLGDARETRVISHSDGGYRREDAGFPSITSINLELEDCQSETIPVSKTNLSECQGQEAGSCLRVLFPSQTYQ